MTQTGIDSHPRPPCLVASLSHPARSPFIINTWLFSTIANIANRDQISTYLSQVTGNHMASTELSMAKQYYDPDLLRLRYKVDKVVFMKQGFHINA